VIIILLLLLAFFGFSSSPTYTTGLGTATPTRVPNVVGVAAPSAERLVRRAGLVPVERWCAVPSPGGYAVARQSPTAGSPLHPGTRVRLFLVPALGQGVRHPPCNSFVGSQP